MKKQDRAETARGGVRGGGRQRKEMGCSGQVVTVPTAALCCQDGKAAEALGLVPSPNPSAHGLQRTQMTAQSG